MHYFLIFSSLLLQLFFSQHQSFVLKSRILSIKISNLELQHPSSFLLRHNSDTIVSPFDESVSPTTETVKDDEELSLTKENVEIVLDSMRPYLKSDG